MGIRETMNQKPALAAGVGGGLLVLAIAFGALQLSAGGGPSGDAFFTTDDGQTWFAADASRLAPFQHEGKEAVRAYVYECPDGEPFVNHLERHTPEGRKMIEAAAESARTGKPPPRAPSQGASMWGLEIKKPGDKQWIPASNLAKSGPMMHAKCPDGQSEPVLVVP